MGWLRKNNNNIEIITVFYMKEKSNLTVCTPVKKKANYFAKNTPATLGAVFM